MTTATACTTRPASVAPSQTHLAGPIAARHQSAAVLGDPAPSQRATCYATLSVVADVLAGNRGGAQHLWQDAVTAAAASGNGVGLGRSLRPQVIAAARTVLAALPGDAVLANERYRTAEARLTGALAAAVDAQKPYPTLAVTTTAAGRDAVTFGIEVHPATADDGTASPWMSARVLPHLFRGTVGNPGGRVLGRHGGVIIICWRAPRVSVHQCLAGHHPLGLCTECEPFARALRVVTGEVSA